MSKKYPTTTPEPLEVEAVAEPTFVEPQPVFVNQPFPSSPPYTEEQLGFFDVAPTADHRVVNAALVSLIEMRGRYVELGAVEVNQGTSVADRAARDYNKSIAESVHLDKAIEHLGFLFKQLEPTWPVRIEAQRVVTVTSHFAGGPGVTTISK